MRKDTEIVDTDTGLEDRKLALENKLDGTKFDEEWWLKDRPEWICGCYFSIDKCILELKPQQIRKEYFGTYIKYSYRNILLTYVIIAKTSERLKMWVKLAYKDLPTTPLFIRDYSLQNRRPGVLITFDDEREFRQNQEVMLRVVWEVLKKAISGLDSKKRRNLRTPLQVKTNPVPEVVNTAKCKIGIEVGLDGLCDISIRCHKSSLTELLEKILD